MRLSKLHLLLLLIYLTANSVFSQSIFGKWKTIDDESGKAKSIVEIYEKEGKVYGKIIRVLNSKKKNPICDKCKDENKDQPIKGMVIINALTKDDEVYKNGTILNPSNGKVYDCRLKLKDKDILQVRGYVAFFYKTQYWERVQ